MKHNILVFALFISACSKTETPAPVKNCGKITDKQAFANSIDNNIKYMIWWTNGPALVVKESEYNTHDKGGEICLNPDGSIAK